MRHVVFVGGTSYSGSTLLDLILSHDPAALSCGELASFIHPYRRKHLTPQCGCGDPACDLWARIDRRPRRVHRSLFDALPDKTVHIDSSKSPIWIEEQTRLLVARGIKVSNVLIFKTPAEFYASRRKRGLERNWIEDWIAYHRRYFTLIREWTSVPYAALVTDPTALRDLCARLGIRYFEGKHRYWRQTHHTLFGNASARIHLYDAGTAGYQSSAAELARVSNGDVLPIHHHRRLHPAGVPEPVPEIPSALTGETADVLGVLAGTDFRRHPVQWRGVDPVRRRLRVPKSFFALQRVHRAILSWRTRHLS